MKLKVISEYFRRQQRKSAKIRWKGKSSKERSLEMKKVRACRKSRKMKRNIEKKLP